MAFLNSIDVVGSGLTAQKLRLDVISENITNLNTTRTEEGGAYRRKLVVFEENESNFASILNEKNMQASGGGVSVTEIVEDPSDLKVQYDPTHPDANEDGYVELPNIDLVKEMADAMAANQAFSANVSAYNVLKEMIAKGLQIGK